MGLHLVYGGEGVEPGQGMLQTHMITALLGQTDSLLQHQQASFPARQTAIEETHYLNDTTTVNVYLSTTLPHCLEERIRSESQT